VGPYKIICYTGSLLTRLVVLLRKEEPVSKGDSTRTFYRSIHYRPV
jgi:hypothetical protein